jgi:hypothetical protein
MKNVSSTFIKKQRLINKKILGSELHLCRQWKSSWSQDQQASRYPSTAFPVSFFFFLLLQLIRVVACPPLADWIGFDSTLRAVSYLPAPLVQVSTPCKRVGRNMLLRFLYEWGSLIIAFNRLLGFTKSSLKFGFLLIVELGSFGKFSKTLLHLT